MVRDEEKQERGMTKRKWVDKSSYRLREGDVLFTLELTLLFSRGIAQAGSRRLPGSRHLGFVVGNAALG
jgi:hypothetical protein